MNEDVEKPIVKCVCTDTTFVQMKLTGLKSLEDIEKSLGCGLKCGLCRPYIAKMLETGETRFPVD